MAIFVDFTHVHRPVTGLERIALDLFSSRALEPLQVTHITASSIIGMASQQWVSLPWRALKRPGSIVLCPGFPPSIALQMACRGIIPYIHDLFAIEQPQILDRAALYYSRPSLARLLRRQNIFLVNSEKTRSELLAKLQRPARVELYRSIIQNIFQLQPRAPEPLQSTIRFVALGTIEPRKNYNYAADIIEALNARGCEAELRIIGQPGWGPDRRQLTRRNHVEPCGYLSKAEVRRIVLDSDVLISTSLDEGLGLPLLELQYAGLLTVAVDIPIFREVLKGHSLYIPQAEAGVSAGIILHYLKSENWRAAGRVQALRILDHYNCAASRDRETAIELIREVERTAIEAAMRPS